MEASVTTVFVVYKIRARGEETEILMSFNNREEAEKFKTAIGNPITLCENGEKPKPHQYLWSDRFRIAEVSLF